MFINLTKFSRKPNDSGSCPSTKALADFRNMSSFSFRCFTILHIIIIHLS